ncbi:hypothetical protein D3C80_1351250 [compost metagenome]
MPLPQAATTLSGRVSFSLEATSLMYWSRKPSTRSTRPPGRATPSPLRTISFRRVISSGPKVRGAWAPILTPVQPFSLWLAVTMATQGQSRANWA